MRKETNHNTTQAILKNNKQSFALEHKHLDTQSIETSKNTPTFFSKKFCTFQNLALSLHSLSEKLFSTNGTGEVGEWLKPAVC